MCHPDAPSRSAIVVSLLQVIVILPTSMIIGSLVAADAAARAAAPRPVRLEDATTDQRTDASASTTTRLATPTTPEIRFNNILAAEEDGSQVIASDGIWKATTPAHMPGTAIVTIDWTLNGASPDPRHQQHVPVPLHQPGCTRLAETACQPCISRAARLRMCRSRQTLPAGDPQPTQIQASLV